MKTLPLFAACVLLVAGSAAWAASSNKTRFITDTSPTANTVPFMNAAPADDGTNATALGVQVGGTERMRVTATGSVGIGTTTPAATQEINGDVKIGTARRVCASANAGTLQYTATNISGCDGAAWKPLDPVVFW